MKINISSMSIALYAVRRIKMIASTLSQNMLSDLQLSHTPPEIMKRRSSSTVTKKKILPKVLPRILPFFGSPITRKGFAVFVAGGGVFPMKSYTEHLTIVRPASGKELI